MSMSMIKGRGEGEEDFSIDMLLLKAITIIANAHGLIDEYDRITARILSQKQICSSVLLSKGLVQIFQA